jgi:hypothetical protein
MPNSTKATAKVPAKKTSKVLSKPHKTVPLKAIAKAVKKTVATSKTSLKPSTASKTTSKILAAPTNSSLAKVVEKPLTPKISAKPAIKNLLQKQIKAKKIKLVRDSFTIPKPEYLILDNLKLRAADLKHPVKKSELLRAGIKALAAMADSHFLAALKVVPMLKTGRPSK